ncbi:hypothetical protein BO94DRAFT_541149 [Aspergillus sclerotioniger CBS 115572]|uniref:Uncharacterized protein n=1 Tax=Aspergillus sclerotioniger CBS 115572 TaxID=1450535 RepID=A0A317XCG0_9EURO|nr:hypothetical protein BO94DRAFT_541149 [Aspergillus sclerotioniger CBS 115572]PWY96314.1 hypothetical protein BO94DRAFT_541149 [Aspergillus sclerotioniger CBS 115572]
MGDSKHLIREHIIDQIPRIIFELLQKVDSTAIRILGDTPTSVLDPGDYLKSIRPFVSKIQDCVHESYPEYKTCFLSVNIYRGKHSYFVVDVNNIDYDYETAHTCKTPIPVYVLRLSKRKPTLHRTTALDEQLAETLADMHNGHGRDPLPLFDDYNDPNIQYRNPRSLQR